MNVRACTNCDSERRQDAATSALFVRSRSLGFEPHTIATSPWSATSGPTGTATTLAALVRQALTVTRMPSVLLFASAITGITLMSERPTIGMSVKPREPIGGGLTRPE